LTALPVHQALLVGAKRRNLANFTLLSAPAQFFAVLPSKNFTFTNLSYPIYLIFINWLAGTVLGRKFSCAKAEMPTKLIYAPASRINPIRFCGVRPRKHAMIFYHQKSRH